MKKCVDNYYEQNGGEGKRLADMGYEPGQDVIGLEYSDSDMQRLLQQVSGNQGAS